MSDDIEAPQEEVELVDYNYLLELTQEQLISKVIELDERANEWPKMTRAQVMVAIEKLKDYPKVLMQGAMYLEKASQEVAQEIQTLKDMLGEIGDYMPVEVIDEDATNEGDETDG